MAVMAEGVYAEREDARRLRGSRALATGLLAVAAALFGATLLLPNPGGGLLFLRAVAEAALVGGLADWFAVTALFRRPLGLPIPHTAILPAHKDRIGEGLARFLDRNFLTPDLLLPELRALGIAERLAEWLAQRRNAAALAREIARALPHFLRTVDDRQIRAFLGRALGQELRRAQLAPLLGQLTQVLTAAGYHEAVLDAALDYAGQFLADHEERLVEAAADRRRRWMPRAINREIAKAMLRGAAELIADLRQPEGTARQALLGRIAAFGEPSTPAEGPATTPAPPLLKQAAVRAWIADAWSRCRDLLLHDLAAPEPRCERALTMMLASIGDTLKSDAEMRARLDATIAAIVIEALPWRSELLRFVAEVVRRWEPHTFSDRIEAAVGADLQYIRMNGTIVGGLVGGILYALSLLAG